MNENPYECAGWLGSYRPGGAALTERLMTWSALALGSVVLDVGCGEGASCEHLRRLGYQARGLDCSEVLIERGRVKFPRCELVAGDAAMPPFLPASQDALLMECVLSAADGPRILAGCVPLLRPGGLLLMSDVYARKRLENTGKPVLYSQEQLEDLLTAAGLRVLNFEDVSSLLTAFYAQKLFDGVALEQLLCTSLEHFRRGRAGYCLLVADKE